MLGNPKTEETLKSIDALQQKRGMIDTRSDFVPMGLVISRRTINFIAAFSTLHFSCISVSVIEKSVVKKNVRTFWGSKMSVPLGNTDKVLVCRLG